MHPCQQHIPNTIHTKSATNAHRTFSFPHTRYLLSIELRAKWIHYSVLRLKAYSLVWSQALYHELKLLKRDAECKAVMTENIQTYGHNVRTTLVTPTAEVSPVQLYLVLIVAGQCMLAGGDMQCIFCCSGFLSL